MCFGWEPLLQPLVCELLSVSRATDQQLGVVQRVFCFADRFGLGLLSGSDSASGSGSVSAYPTDAILPIAFCFATIFALAVGLGGGSGSLRSTV